MGIFKSLIFTTMALLISVAVQASEPTAKSGYHLDKHSFKSGEWPLPVRVAPFPVQDIIGNWDLGEGRPVLDVRNPRSFPGQGGVFVDIRLIDRTTGTVIGSGPGQVVNNMLSSNRLEINNKPFLMRLVSLVPPKNSIEAQSNEKVVYLYISGIGDKSRTATYRVRKLK